MSVDAASEEVLTEVLNDFIHRTVKFGRKGIVSFGDWLYELNDADFKAVGNIVFGVSKAARKTGDWGRLPHLRYRDWSFRKTYRFVQMRRPR